MSDTALPSTDATAVAAFPQRAEDRLRLAMRRLDEALKDQSDAARSLREAVGDLSATMARLGTSTAGYSVALDTTAAEVERTLESTRKLEATAARMLS